MAELRRNEVASDYDSDFYGWATEQAALLRQGRVSEADIANIAEEIESLGKNEKRELVSRLTVLLTHLLKWQFQPGLRGTSWRLTIEEQRAQLEDHLAENPSLRAILGECIARAYKLALLAARKETGLAEHMFPAGIPYTEAQMFDLSFFPD